MVKSITFSGDDLIFISNLNASTGPAELIGRLKEATQALKPDETINVEMSDDNIEQLLLAEKEWDDCTGLIGHLATIFHHEAHNATHP